MNKVELKSAEQDEIILMLAALSRDPYRFVLWAFPWGEKGTELEGWNGPEEWQCEILKLIRDDLISIHEAIQIAIASGHGIGKSALVAWLILWGISTFEDAAGVVTANTEKQLKTKTWAQLAKWYNLFLGKYLFKMTATALFSSDPAHERTWRCDMVPWSKENPEAFAGLHNQGKRIVLIFDEGSTIPDIIWETSEGALTDANTQILWFVAGNPTRNVGRFRDCFGKAAHRWETRKIDSRSVTLSNKTQIAKWEEDWGADSDFFRVRVRGEFPSAATLQLIPTDWIEAARKRTPVSFPNEALVISCDVARFGNNESVISRRRGRDARLETERLRGKSTVELAGRLSSISAAEFPDALFIDGGGVGGGVVDQVRALGHSCHDVQFGGSADSRPAGAKVANKRAEMFVALKDWLKDGVIPDDDELQDQLTSIEYTFNKRDEILIISKEDMRALGVDSPDWADALAMTFALPVALRSRGMGGRKHIFDYDPMNQPEEVAA